MNRNRWLVLAGLGVILVAYCGTYAVLSRGGRYEPMVWGLQDAARFGGLSPKSWAWMPTGFTHPDGSLSRPVFYLFAPLYRLDRACWHHKRLPSRTDAYEARYARYVP